MVDDFLREVLRRLAAGPGPDHPMYAGPETLRGRVRAWGLSNGQAASEGLRVQHWDERFGDDWLLITPDEGTLARWFARAQDDGVPDLSSWVAERERSFHELGSRHGSPAGPNSELVSAARDALGSLWRWKSTPPRLNITAPTLREFYQSRNRFGGDGPASTVEPWQAVLPGDGMDIDIVMTWDNRSRDELVVCRLDAVPGVEPVVARLAIEGLLAVLSWEERKGAVGYPGATQSPLPIAWIDCVADEPQDLPDITCRYMGAPFAFQERAERADVFLGADLVEHDRLRRTAEAWELPRRRRWIGAIRPDVDEQAADLATLSVETMELWDQMVPWMRRATVLNRDRSALALFVQFVGAGVTHYFATAEEEEKERLATQIAEACRVVALIGLVRFGPTCGVAE